METFDIISIVVLIVANLPIYFMFGKLFFKDADEFGEAIYFWLKPDILSAFQGEFWEDMAAEFKLGLWVACCVGATCLEYYFLVDPYILPLFKS